MKNSPLFERLKRDEAGNFGIMAAVAMVPLAVGVGLAIDFTSLNTRHSQLQNALDAAALAVGREGKHISEAQAYEIAHKFVSENFEVSYRDLDILRDGPKVTVTASLDEPLHFAGVLGYDTAKVSGASTVELAFTKYEIALVLDTTGSMKGGKLTAMKDAVLGLVDTMSKQIEKEEHLKFAVVPFANMVNVGSHFGPQFNKKGKIKKGTGAEWLDLKGKADFPQLELKKNVSRFEVFHNLGEEWAGCVETRYSTGKKGKDYDVADIEPTKKDKNSLFVPAFSIDEPDDGYANSYVLSNVDPLDKSLTGQTKKLLKYGVVDPLLTGGGDDDDEDDDDGDDSAANGGTGNVDGWNPVELDGSGGKGPNKDCLTQPIKPLTTDYAGIKKMVDSLEANGTTNIMEGVAWGMRVLSPHEPFAEGREKGRGIEKVMIVLTDGANVFGNNYTKLRSGYSSNGYLVDGRLGITWGSSSDTNRIMNEKTLAACENAKKDGVIVYTIRLEEPDVETGTMLKECATSTAHFFDAPSRSQLDEVFEEIGKNVVKLRISS